MNGFQQQLSAAGEKLGLGSASFPDRKTRKQSRQRRTGKSRAKMWFMTLEVLTRHPEASDADINRAVRKKFDEGVSSSLIQEARWIFQKKVDKGEIVLAGRPARLNVVKTLYDRLCSDDKKRFNTWVSEQPR